MTAKQLVIIMVLSPPRITGQKLTRERYIRCKISQGVSGTGKSTLAKSLADRLGFPVIDGDDHHPKSNIEKMDRGEALNDQDRLPWLGHLREIGIRKLEEEIDRRNEQSGGKGTVGEEVGVVLACSSLKRSYRQILRGRLKVERAPDAHHGEITYEAREADQKTSPALLPATYFVWIKGSKEVLRDRLLKRQGHFFKANMLDGQLQDLELPEGEPDVVLVPLELSTEEQTDLALKGLREISGAENTT
jgi:gluconokinase